MSIFFIYLKYILFLTSHLIIPKNIHLFVMLLNQLITKLILACVYIYIIILLFENLFSLETF